MDLTNYTSIKIETKPYEGIVKNLKVSEESKNTKINFYKSLKDSEVKGSLPLCEILELYKSFEGVESLKEVRKLGNQHPSYDILKEKSFCYTFGATFNPSREMEDLVDFTNHIFIDLDFKPKHKKSICYEFVIEEIKKHLTSLPGLNFVSQSIGGLGFTLLFKTSGIKSKEDYEEAVGGCFQMLREIGIPEGAIDKSIINFNRLTIQSYDVDCFIDYSNCVDLNDLKSICVFEKDEKVKKETVKGNVFQFNQDLKDLEIHNRIYQAFELNWNKVKLEYDYVEGQRHSFLVALIGCCIKDGITLDECLSLSVNFLNQLKSNFPTIYSQYEINKALIVKVYEKYYTDENVESRKGLFLSSRNERYRKLPYLSIPKFKYLGDVKEVKDNMKTYFKGRNIIIAPTGSGKNHLINKYVNLDKNTKVIILVPTSLNAVSIQKQFGFEISIYGQRNSVKGKRKIVCCWASAQKMLLEIGGKDYLKELEKQGYTIIIDEWHNMVDDIYSEHFNNMVDLLSNYKDITLMSGTPVDSSLPFLKTFKIHKFEMDWERNVKELKIVQTSNRMDYVRRALKKYSLNKSADKLLALYYNNKGENLDALIEYVKRLGLNPLVANSTTKNDESFIKLAKGDLSEYDVLIFTSVLKDSVSILTKYEKVEILSIEPCTTSEHNQIMSRFRNAKLIEGIIITNQPKKFMKIDWAKYKDNLFLEAFIECDDLNKNRFERISFDESIFDDIIENKYKIPIRHNKFTGKFEINYLKIDNTITKREKYVVNRDDERLEYDLEGYDIKFNGRFFDNEFDTLLDKQIKKEISAKIKEKSFKDLEDLEDVLENETFADNLERLKDFSISQFEKEIRNLIGEVQVEFLNPLEAFLFIKNTLNLSKTKVEIFTKSRKLNKYLTTYKDSPASKLLNILLNLNIPLDKFYIQNTLKQLISEYVPYFNKNKKMTNTEILNIIRMFVKLDKKSTRQGNKVTTCWYIVGEQDWDYAPFKEFKPYNPYNSCEEVNSTSVDDSFGILERFMNCC